MKMIARVKANGVNKNMPITSIEELNLIRATFVEAQRAATLARNLAIDQVNEAFRGTMRQAIDAYWRASSVNAQGFAEGHAEGV